MSTSSRNDIKIWWTDKLNSITSESSRPKGKSELRSLLLDENRLDSHFEQHADGPGPAETEYIIDAQEQENENPLAGFISDDWIRTAGLGDDEGGHESDVRIEIDGSARASRFDP